MKRSLPWVVVLALALAACAQALSANPPAEPAPPPTASVIQPAPTERPTTSVTTTTARTTTTTTTTAATVEVAGFEGEIAAIDDAIGARMSASWRPGCPVGLDELRLLRVTHHDFAGGVSAGELVVHRDVAIDILAVFAALFGAGYPIERIELVDVYGGDDDLSMAANNTSAFNCRFIAGTRRWSENASGAAIDLNPLINPYVRGSQVDPPDGAAYADRSGDHPALIRPGGPVTEAFAAIGWEWGGTWASAQDYQHFSLTGR